jgi:hypothetical protein
LQLADLAITVVASSLAMFGLNLSGKVYSATRYSIGYSLTDL